MTLEALSHHLETFLALKQTRAKSNPHFNSDHRGRLRYEEGMLRGFVAYWQQHGCPWPIRAEFALDWVMTGSSVGRPYRDEHRLTSVRSFLHQVRACDERTEIPQTRFRSIYRRRAPYLFSDQEVLQLMEAAARSRYALRAATVATLIGLLASTGIRIGEALHLKMEDVRLDATPPHLFIHESKFGKSRNVVLHRSTTAQLRLYLKKRDAALRGRFAEPFFTNTLRRPLIYNPLRYTFRHLLKQVGISPSVNQRRPTLHSFRHTFAVNRLALWRREGRDIRQQLPHLSVYLGHCSPESTYWYLSATPELLQGAGDLFDPQQQAERGDHR